MLRPYLLMPHVYLFLHHYLFLHRYRGV